MRNVARRAIGLGVAAFVVAGALLAWPFPSNPQCGPAPLCSDGCYVPPSPKCEQWAIDQLDADPDIVACDLGDGPGVCRLG